MPRRPISVNLDGTSNEKGIRNWCENAMRALASIMVIGSFSLSVGARSASNVSVDIAVALTSFGLHGTWAADCSRPTTIDNPKLIIDLSTIDFPMLQTRTAPPSDTGEAVSIEWVQLVAADTLELKLNSLTSDPDIFYDRTDVYKRTGTTMRLWRSERTAASRSAQALGYGAHMLWNYGISTDLVSGSYSPSPVLEQCSD